MFSMMDEKHMHLILWRGRGARGGGRDKLNHLYMFYSMSIFIISNQPEPIE